MKNYEYLISFVHTEGCGRTFYVFDHEITRYDIKHSEEELNSENPKKSPYLIMNSTLLRTYEE